jgi:hypothetical protein
MKKVRLNTHIIKLASCFADYESDVLPPDSRLVEYPFVFSRLVNQSKARLLDIGCSARHNFLVPTLCELGWEVWGIDIRDWAFSHTNFHLIKEDIRYSRFPSDILGYVVCISTLEHIGLSGYYGITTDDKDGDIMAGYKIAKLLKQGGKLLLTVPYSQDYIVKSGTKIFNSTRLHIVFPDFEVIDKQFYTLNKDKNCWQSTSDISEEVVACFEMVRK